MLLAGDDTTLRPTTRSLELVENEPEAYRVQATCLRCSPGPSGVLSQTSLLVDPGYTRCRIATADAIGDLHTPMVTLDDHEDAFARRQI